MAGTQTTTPETIEAANAEAHSCVSANRPMVIELIAITRPYGQLDRDSFCNDAGRAICAVTLVGLVFVTRVSRAKMDLATRGQGRGIVATG